MSTAYTPLGVGDLTGESQQHRTELSWTASQTCAACSINFSTE